MTEIVSRADENNVSSDEELGSNCSILDTSSEDRGFSAIKYMCTLTASKFYRVLVMLTDDFSTTWNVAEGERKVLPEKISFLCVSVCLSIDDSRNFRQDLSSSCVAA